MSTWADARAAHRAWAPTYDEALRLRLDDPCTNTDDERAAARAHVARHQLNAEDGAELLRALGLDS